MHYIPIETCLTCPHRDHAGAFGRIAYIPICRKAGRELPWRPSATKGGSVIATSDGVIPEWCPLPSGELK